MKSPAWSAFPFLPALRPPLGWRTRTAVLAAYSADPLVLTAAILALSGKGDEAGRGSRPAKVEALTSLQGRLRVLVQRGRLSSPTRPSPALALLDHYVREVGLDGAKHSWHPKLAAVVFESVQDLTEIEVRLWLGSRNLTTDISWDLALSIVGVNKAEGGAPPPPGLERLFRDLWKEADRKEDSDPFVGSLPDLDSLGWFFPKGVEEVRRLRLFLGDEDRELPSRRTCKSLWAISPFLDSQTVTALASWPCPDKKLLTTRAAAAKLAARDSELLRKFDLRVLERPSDDHVCVPDSDLEDARPAEPSAEDDEPRIDSWSLHAKAILATDSEGAELWLGSPNLTRRGWSRSAAGHCNAEAHAHARVGLAFAEELKRLFDLHAQQLRVEDLRAEPDDQDSAERVLEDLQTQLAASWDVVQEAKDLNVLLRTRSPWVLAGGVELQVRPFGRPSARAWQAWPSEESAITLAGVSWAEASELVEIQLVFGDAARRWVSRAPFQAGPPLDRDLVVIARWLGLRGFFQLLRSHLLGEEPASDEENEPEGPKGSQFAAGSAGLDLEGLAPSLEEILRAWQREGPGAVERTHQEIQRYGKVFARELEDSEREQLEAFLENWAAIVSGLGIDVS